MWTVSPPYAPVTVAVPADEPVNVTEHVPAVNEQLVDPSEPAPVEVKVTVPIGVVPVPVDVSATVAVHVEA